jgi:hypothetical protein
MFMFMVFFGCKSQTYTLDSLPERKLEFGHSGGFTGMKITYTLLENGQLFMSTGFQKMELERVKKRDTKEIFEEADEMIKEGISQHEVGNQSDYISFNDGKQLKEWKWPSGPIQLESGGFGRFPIPKELEELYSILFKTIPTKK